MLRGNELIRPQKPRKARPNISKGIDYTERAKGRRGLYYTAIYQPGHAGQKNHVKYLWGSVYNEEDPRRQSTLLRSAVCILPQTPAMLSSIPLRLPIEIQGGAGGKLPATASVEQVAGSMTNHLLQLLSPFLAILFASRSNCQLSFPPFPPFFPLPMSSKYPKSSTP